MGTFFGHIEPGIFFILYGLHMAIFTMKRYFRYLKMKRLNPNEQFQCTPTFANAYTSNYHVEALAKVS